jgi:antitoxin (DNA-binding transcriptional repressor) of toxin-antitoxin stability system
MKVASISELKDSLSAHLDRVRSGEMVVVTDRKSPLATLERIAPGSLTNTEKRMVSDGIISPRKQTLNVDSLLAMPLGISPRGITSTILDERAESP